MIYYMVKAMIMVKTLLIVTALSLLNYIASIVLKHPLNNYNQ